MIQYIYLLNIGFFISLGGYFMKMQESGEMYLETILILSQRNTQVRSIDIVNELGYSKPSISRAVNLLKKENYIDIDGKGYIILTEKGQEIASRMYERHQLLTKCLVALGVDKDTAANDACRIEHVISAQSFEKIKQYAQDKLL